MLRPQIQLPALLEVVTQRELHDARDAHRIGVRSELAKRQAELIRSLSRIEAWRVGRVKHFPCKLQVLLFGNFPALEKPPV